MKWKEAEQFLIRGKRIRRPTFSNENYWYLENNIIMNGSTKDKAYINIKVLNADDWYVVEDKKTLSDKRYFSDDMSDLGRAYYEEDVKEYIDNFIIKLRIHTSADPYDIDKYAEETFGKRLLK